MGEQRLLIREELRDANISSDEELRDFWTGSVTPASGIHEAYLRYSANVPLKSNVIFYETMSGDRMNDNPYAIFEYLRSHPEYGDFLHVWSMSQHGAVPDEFANDNNVLFAPRDSLAYAYFLACAEHVVCNAILPSFFNRRPEQKYLNTWHGIPYKALGRRAARARFGSGSGIGTFLKATHLITPCEFMTDALLLDYSMRGVSTARVAETGYPRIDLTVNAGAESVVKLRNELGLKEVGGEDGGPPVVLYAPTWRGSEGQDTVDADQLVRDLDALAALDIQLMYRGHHRMGRLIQDRTIGDQVGRVIVPSNDISSNELLTAVDILITDYSSIFFDFLPTGRPIVHYLYDLDDYARTRGLNLRTDELPGAVALSTDELVDVVRNSARALIDLEPDANLAASPLQGAAYKSAQARFAPHEDGASSARAVEFFLKDRTDGVRVTLAKDARPTVAMWAGDVTGEPSSEAFLRKAVALAKTSRYQVTLMIARGAFIEKETVRAIKGVRDKLSVIAYDKGTPMLVPEEVGTYEAFINQNPATFRDASKALRKDSAATLIFSREYRRRLDDAHFDILLVGPELDAHELALSAFACHKPLSQGATRKLTPSFRARLRRVTGALLPKGSGVRRRAERVYRSLRHR